MRWALFLVLLLLVPIVSALPGLPNCCPTGLDDIGLIRHYENESLLFYPEPCDEVCIDARDQYIDRKLARARTAMEKKIADCASGVEFNTQQFADDAESACATVREVLPPWDEMKEEFDTGSDPFAGTAFADASTYGIEAAMVGDYKAAYEDCIVEDDRDQCHHDDYWQSYCWIEAYHAARSGVKMECTIDDEFVDYYKFSKGVVVIGADVEDEGTLSLTLDSTIYDQSEPGLDGVISFSCVDDCTGKSVNVLVEAVDSSMKFDVVYDGDAYVSSSRTILDFTIVVDDYDPVVHKTDPITVNVVLAEQTETFTFLPGSVGGVVLTPSTWKMKQGDTIQVDVAVDGPDLDYLYVFSTALDGMFEFEGKEMANAVVNGGRKASVKWTTPEISRVVSAEEFDDVRPEAVQSAIKELYKNVFSNYRMAAGAFNGIVQDDVVVSLGMEGFVPAGFTGEDYADFVQASKEYNPGAMTIPYSLPIKVIVQADGYPQQEDSIQVSVLAPEALK